MMIIVAGLGNPGKEYSGTRHNIGYSAIDYMVDQYAFQKKGTTFKSKCFQGRVGRHHIMMLKPETYMNLSGDAIHLAKQYYKIPSTQVIVIYDDVDTNFEIIRIRKQGGPGTHNGMKSIVHMIGNDFMRIRIGIGPKPEKWELNSFVLSDFNAFEKKTLPTILKNTSDAVMCIIDKGIDTAMNQFNKKTPSI
ncbi:MAG: aminoacyl-tRNA hydrolase [Candidatus Margulisbacteria bacterium]|nr:aminoacyl-tRNA hydrolase [Candidatus Margulisiibacteriota bacterium]